MIRHFLIGLLALHAIMWALPHRVIADDPAATVTDSDFELRSRSLFDGESLAGWEGKSYWFQIDEGAIVAGRLEEKIPENQFLCTMEQFDDFDLRFEARLVGVESTDKLNAGVQIRSRRPTDADEGVPANEMVGYQADIGSAWGRSIWGALYDESRRRVMLAEPAHPVDVALGKWASIRVVCKGPRVQIFVNGKQTVDYTETDPSIPLVGVIGLQIHSGPAAQCWYRNLKILSI